MEGKQKNEVQEITHGPDPLLIPVHFTICSFPVCIIVTQFKFKCMLQKPEFNDDSLSKIDCLLCAVGSDDETMYSKSLALQVRG